MEFRFRWVFNFRYFFTPDTYSLYHYQCDVVQKEKVSYLSESQITALRFVFGIQRVEKAGFQQVLLQCLGTASAKAAWQWLQECVNTVMNSGHPHCLLLCCVAGTHSAGYL